MLLPIDRRKSQEYFYSQEVEWYGGGAGCVHLPETNEKYCQFSIKYYKK